MTRTPKIVLAGLLVVACSLRAHASATLTIYDGVNPLIAVVDNGPGDQFGLTGYMYVYTNVGVWSFTITSAETKPILGSATSPQMDLNVQGSSTAAGSLRVVFSDNGFGPINGTLNAAVTDHLTSGGPGTLSYDVYGDPANVVGATTVHITSIGPVPLGTPGATSGPEGLPSPFSLTQVVQVNASGAAGFNSDSSLNIVPIPEPGVIGLGALGLLVLASRRASGKRA